MRKKILALLLGAALCVFASVAFAHTPILNCYMDGDMVVCEGGFSNGASAAGVQMTVRDANKNVILEAKLDDLGMWSFKRPEGDFEVEFNAGPGHVVVVQSADIE